MLQGLNDTPIVEQPTCPSRLVSAFISFNHVIQYYRAVPLFPVSEWMLSFESLNSFNWILTWKITHTQASKGWN